jgi:hypothetical protein
MPSCVHIDGIASIKQPQRRRCGSIRNVRWQAGHNRLSVSPSRAIKSHLSQLISEEHETRRALACEIQGVLGAALSLLLRSSIAQSAAMVSRSLMMCVALTLPNVAGVRVGSSRSRTCFDGVAVTPPESNCLIASIVAKRCAVVSFIASRFL